ncbi:hypothetical protein IWQ60_010166 [Tieghemiomyces parasiticus]|uniref:Uncharacterized protein n=1 Tax=Tieghemiomyces parasiticus TaxID=78921 RepID=A0A9W8DK04_9FUNG|nr:hypothetical protein IWQ60_010166 [Tieghemiomyces parasiticus]
MGKADATDTLTEAISELNVSTADTATKAVPTTTDDGPAVKPWKGKRALGRHPEQSILTVIRLACHDLIDDPDFAAKLRSIKERFLVRDYVGVFSNPPNLPIYAAQYIPGRSLCYFELFRTEKALRRILNGRPRVFCMGAGAGSELVALMAASLYTPTDADGNLIQGKTSVETTKDSRPPHHNGKHGARLGSVNPRPVVCHIQDFADWQPVLNRLETTIRDVWHVPRSWFQIHFTQSDLLDPDTDRLAASLAEADLVTSLFVMNELFCEQAKAMALVNLIIKHLRPGKHFLLIDSAGSFSEIKVGNNTYMLYTVFDSLKRFFKPILSDNARWYRYPENVSYPLKLDNMQYYLRLYERL